MRTPSDPRVSPDGSQVAFVVSQPDLEVDTYRRSIWLWDGESATAATDGFVDSRPRWAPDGSRLAFLRATVEAPTSAAVMVMDMASRSVEEVATFSVGANETEWSPDGAKLAVVGTEWTDEYAGLNDAERQRRPARLRRAHFQVDNQLPTHDRRKHVWLVADGAKRLITEGPYDERDVTWHPDGEKLAFISSRQDDRDTSPGAQVFELDLSGSDPKAITGTGFFDAVAYDPDGTAYVVGLADAWEHPSVASIFRVDDDGLVDLTGHLDRDPLPFSPTIAPKGPQFIDDGFLSVLEDDGRVVVVRLGPDGTSRLVDGDLVVTGVDAGPTGSAYVASNAQSPGELFWHDGKVARRVTTLNEGFELVEPEQFTVVSDGVEITAWVYLPRGDEPVPTLLSIHGGPASQYGVGFFDEFQVYAGAGYGVVACNPRGSSGRGKDFVRAVVGTWTDDVPPDIRDFNAVLEGAIERFPRLDGDRIGVMGGSYGGWAAAQLIGRDQRYRSAVVERPVTAWTSFWGTSDIGPWFTKMYLGTDLAEDWQGHVDAGPMAIAHKVTTPTLVLHSASDWRTPIEQGLQFFTMLQHNKVPSQLVRFPDEGHELSRSGRPRHRLERFQAILDWHGEHL